MKKRGLTAQEIIIIVATIVAIIFIAIGFRNVACSAGVAALC